MDSASELQAAHLSSVAGSLLCWRQIALFLVGIGCLFRVTCQGFIPLFSCGQGAEQWGEGSEGTQLTRARLTFSSFIMWEFSTKMQSLSPAVPGVGLQLHILLLLTRWVKGACFCPCTFSYFMPIPGAYFGRAPQGSDPWLSPERPWGPDFRLQNFLKFLLWKEIWPTPGILEDGRKSRATPPQIAKRCELMGF